MSLLKDTYDFWRFVRPRAESRTAAARLFWTHGPFTMTGMLWGDVLVWGMLTFMFLLLAMTVKIVFAQDFAVMWFVWGVMWLGVGFSSFMTGFALYVWFTVKFR